MTTAKKTFVIGIFLLTASLLSAQVKVVKRYEPSANTTKTTNSVKPQTYSDTPAPISADDNASSRRAAALSKVQGHATQPSRMTAKGLAPATYSTDDELTPAAYSAEPNPSTTMTVNGLNVQRNVRKGHGQVGDRLFTPVSELYFVQFAVYCKNTPVDKAPPVEGVMLLWHKDSKCPGGDNGACYIVKGYNTADEAKAAVYQFKTQNIDCWFNPALTGAEVEVIGVR